MVYNISTDSEPTPEFNDYCLDVIRRWERGELPYKEAVTLLTQKEQEATSTGHLANQGRIHHVLGYIQHYRGNLDASIRHYDKARYLFQQVKNARRICMMDLNNGENYRLKGDFTRARRLYRNAYEGATPLGDLVTMAMAAINEGLVLLAMGQNAYARKLLTEGYELSQQWTERLESLPSLHCEVHHSLTLIHLAEGDLEQAWQEARRAMIAARASGEGMCMGYAYRALGEAITHLGSAPEDGYHSDPDEYYRLAIESFREMNMEAEMARTIFAQAQSLAHRGRRSTAARKLQQVMIMFTQLGMVDDIAKVAQAQLDVL